MFDWKNFPWTDFQDLNLDWILRKIKELAIVDLPALDKKIDNVYQYIEENLPEIVAQIATVVIDVKAAGAVGDGVTDDTDAIKNAIAMGKIIFFPPGTYCFQSISVDKPLAVWGSGNQSILQPMHKHPLTNQTYCLFDFHDSAYISDLQIRPDNSVESESGTKYPTEAALRANNAPHIHLERVIFENFFNSYRDGQPSEFSDREGMAIGFHDCLEVCFNDCHFGAYGAEELVWISQNRGNYGRGKHTFHNCEFGPKNNTDSGSYLNILGGEMDFSNNYLHDINLINAVGDTGYSVLNILCPWTDFHDNIFKNIKAGDYCGFSEGYYNKLEYLKISNNVFSGQTNRGCQFMARKAEFANNYIESAVAIRTWTETVLPAYNTYCVDMSTVFDFEDINISNNHFMVVAPPIPLTISTMVAPVAIGQANAPATGTVLAFMDNIVDFADDSISLNVLYINSPFVKAIVKGNIFNDCGTISPPASVDGVQARGVVSGHGKVDYIIINDNVIDGRKHKPSSTIIFTGDTNFRDGTSCEITQNRGIGRVLEGTENERPAVRSASISSQHPWVSLDVDANSNIYTVT